MAKKKGIKQVKDGTWKDLDYTLKQARAIMKKEKWEELPSSHFLKKLGCYNDLISGIAKYHGWKKIREKLGQEQTRVANGLWKKLDYTLEQTRKIMQIKGWSELPGDLTLRRSGYSSLSRAIYEYHEGSKRFREKLAEFLEGKSEKQKLEEVLEKYLEN